MSRGFGTSARIGVGLVVSAVCLWLAVQQAPLDELGAVVGRVSFWWLVPSILATLVSLWGRGCRWRALLANRGSRSEYFWAQGIGSLLTNVFPLRAGEAGRVVLIGRRLGIPLVQVGASLVLERAVDLAVVLGLLAALLVIMDVPWPVTATGLALAAALGMAMLGVLVLLLFGRRLTWLVALIAGRLPARLGQLLVDTWGHVLTALEPLRSLRVVATVVAWSLLIWLVSIVSVWASIEAVVPGARPLEATFALTALALGVALPSSPGFIGVFQLIGQQALVAPFPDRYTAANALMFAILNHAVYYVTTTAAGGIGLARLGLSLRSVRPSESPATSAESATEPRPAASAQTP